MTDAQLEVLALTEKIQDVIRKARLSKVLPAEFRGRIIANLSQLTVDLLRESGVAPENAG